MLKAQRPVSPSFIRMFGRPSVLTLILKLLPVTNVPYKSFQSYATIMTLLDFYKIHVNDSIDIYEKYELREKKRDLAQSYDKSPISTETSKKQSD